MINNVLQSPETTVRRKKRKTLFIRFLFRFLLLAVISLSQPLVPFDDKNKRNKKNEEKKTKIIKKKKRSTQKRKKKKPGGGSKLIKRK